MNSGRVMNLRVTIPAESRRMNVGKDVIRILGSPAYICVLQRKDRKSIAITPCTAEHPMSFKVPDRLLTDGQCRMMINGIQFIQVLLEANGLAAGKDHQLKDGMMPRKMQLSFRSKMVNKVLSRLKDVQLDITSIWSYNTSKWSDEGSQYYECRNFRWLSNDNSNSSSCLIGKTTNIKADATRGC